MVSAGYRLCKRAFDVAFSLVVLVLATALLPIDLVVVALVAAESHATPFYVQERVGRNGRPFPLIKIRTMVADSEDAEKYLTEEQLRTWNQEHKVENDPRVTDVGRVLRRLSLDEVPQFLNVLMGQMSVIGPRPVVAGELGNFSDASRRELLAFSPGITGWWQVAGRNAATWANGRRQELELFYARNASLRLDAQVFFRTFGAMLGRAASGR